MAQYQSDPVGAPSFGSPGEYFDVSLSPGSTFTSLTLTDCNLSGGTSLEWWNPGMSAWEPVSNEIFSPGPPACVTATFTNSTIPNLAELTGTVFAVRSLVETTTSVVASPNPSPAGSSVTLTATVSPATATGTVEFSNGATPITGCTAVPLTPAGTATCVTSFASAGTYTVSATYSGNTYYSGSTGTTTVTVNPAASTTALSLSSGSIAYGHEQAETMSVTVSAQSSTLVPTGTVTISAGSATICAITLVDGKGSCTLSASQLQRGTYELVATFAGNADVNGSSSPASSLVVTVKSAIDYYVALLHGLWVANGEPRIGTAKYRSIAHEAWIEAGKPKLPPLLFKQAHAGA